MIVIRVEDVVGYSIEGNEITNIDNLSVAPYSDTGTCNEYHIGASTENPNEFQAGNIRAISVAAARGFENSPSQIKNNQVGRASSNQESGGLVIGIDVQGDTKDTVISGNKVDLGETPWDEGDEYIALRVREAVDGSVSVNTKNNQFAQETQILNAIRMRGRARNLKNSHPGIDTEWDLGGCPYAKTYGKKHAK